MTANRTAQARQDLNPYVVLAVVSFGVFIAADDLTVVSTMLVQMLRDLDISIQTQLDEAAWIVNAYLIAYVVTMPFMGRVSDIFGRRLVFVACLGIFAVGSVMVVLAPNLPWMVVARAVTGIGGGAMVPVAIAIVGDVFPDERRPFAMGILGAVDTAGWIWGPLFGATLVRYLSWRWQFYLNLPLSALAAAAAFYALRDLRSPVVSERGSRRLDVVGFAGCPEQDRSGPVGFEVLFGVEERVAGGHDGVDGREAGHAMIGVELVSLPRIVGEHDVGRVE